MRHKNHVLAYLAKAQSYISAIEVGILEHEHATVIPVEETNQK